MSKVTLTATYMQPFTLHIERHQISQPPPSLSDEGVPIHLAEISLGIYPEPVRACLKLLHTEKPVVMGYFGLRWTSEYGT